MPNEDTKKTASAPKVLVTRPQKNPPPWGYLITGIILLVGSLFLLAKTYQNPSQVSFGNTVVKVQVAQTDKQVEKGLSGQDSLDKNSGMLFVFQKDVKPNFWMKDMKFPLDFIWLSQDGIVKQIDVNISPNTYYTKNNKITSAEPIRYVLEVNAGFVAEHNIRKGDTARVQL